MKSVKAKIKSEETVKLPAPAPTAFFQIFKLPDGPVQYNYGGPESDLLGLIEFGKILVSDKTRMNILSAQQQAHTPSPTLSQESK